MPSSAVQTCARSEEHTSELQSHDNLVCRLLLEKKKPNLARTSSAVPAGAARANTPRHGAGAGAGCALRACLLVWGPVGALGELFLFFLIDGAPPEISPFPLQAPLLI